MNTDIIKSCSDAIATLKSGEATQEQFLFAQEFVTKLGEVYRDLKEQLEVASIAWIEVNGEATDGTRRFYVAPNKTTKCRDVRKTAEAVLTASGGDWDVFAECLSSGAFKPAKTKAVLGENADEFFETTETKDLKTGEVGKKRLQEFDTKFIKGAKQ